MIENIVLSSFLLFTSLVLGSFLNVFIYRLPIIISGNENITLSNPHSHCPSCKKKIEWKDNIPIFSWVLLRGECRYCQNQIPSRYVIVETFVFAFTFVILLINDFKETAIVPVAVFWILAFIVITFFVLSKNKRKVYIE